MSNKDLQKLILQNKKRTLTEEVSILQKKYENLGRTLSEKKEKLEKISLELENFGKKKTKPAKAETQLLDPKDPTEKDIFKPTSHF